MKFAQKIANRQAAPHIHNIIRMGDKQFTQLSQPSIQLQILSERIKNIIQSLKMTAANENAISLSCPQIGINYNIFVMLKQIQYNQWHYENVTPDHYQVFINPEKTKESQLKQVEWEECPTFPFLMGKTERSYEIQYKYKNENFELIEDQANDFKARVIQHEMDHLHGKTLDQVGNTLIESKRESFQYNVNLDSLRLQSQGMSQAMLKVKIDQQKKQ